MSVETFPPPQTPSSLPGPEYPFLKKFLQRQVDMQISDLRLLFRLPFEELDRDTGCNFTAAAMMLNVISGFSLWLFETEQALRIREEEVKKSHPLRGRRFKAFVEEYWPAIPPEPPASDLAGRRRIASRLWEVRNSLAHDLGVDNRTPQENGRNISLVKKPLSLDEIIMRCERNELHPLTVPVVEDRGTSSEVHLLGLYWALHQMLRKAIKEKAQEIDERVSTIGWPEIEESSETSPN